MNGPVHYHSRIRFIAAFVAAVYILFHGRPFDLTFALISPGFYVALAVSLGIALLLAEIVHRATVWLDGRTYWRSDPAERSIMQFTLGIMLPALVDLLLISAYFYAQGDDIRTNGFLLVDFPVIVCFIVFLNIYYIIHYLLQTETAGSKTPETLTVHCNGLYRKLNVAENVFYFYRKGKQVIIVTFDRNEYHISDSLHELEKRFRPYGFIRINRTVIFNFNIVTGYENGTKRNTLSLIPEKKYQETIKQHGADRFVVTNEHIQDVLEYFS